MTARARRIPGPDHPIVTQPHPAHIVVKAAGRIVADTREALIQREASYPAVHYIPRKDVDMSLLRRSGHNSYCPYKGECSYYSIPLGGERAVNAAWSYETPFDAVSAIGEYLAFYPTASKSKNVPPEFSFSLPLSGINP
jgi:uncharacterized protein (DUF427 family)